MADLKVTVIVEVDGEVIAKGVNGGYSSCHTAEALVGGALRAARSNSGLREQRDAALRRYRVMYGDDRKTA